MLGSGAFLVAAGAMVSLAGGGVPGRPALGLGRASFGARVVIGQPILAGAVRNALKGAQGRLGAPRCAGIFTDFHDGAGHTLQQGLDALGTTGPEYLELIHFRNGELLAPCMSGRALAVTNPGSRVVWVCPGFGLTQMRDPRLAEAVLLHEALHSLGLGENPPSSTDITAHVLKRCAR